MLGGLGLDGLGLGGLGLGDLNLPVVLDFDTGHQPPQLPLVNGALADVRLDGASGSITQHLVP